MTTYLKAAIKWLTLALTLVILAACQSSKTSSETVKLGVVGDNNEVWEHVQKKLVKDHIKLELVRFSDYNLPNDALVHGEIDLNAFQHQLFLDNYNKEHQTDLTTIGKTIIAPLGIYSKRLSQVDQISQGSKVSIPNDVTNGGRALVLLQTAGLITLKADHQPSPTVEDIKDNPLGLVIQELDAAQVARSIQDVDLAVINNGLAVDAGYSPKEDALFLEPINEASEPYINIIVARKKDQNNSVYQKIVQAYQQDDTKKVIEATYKGSSIPAWE